MASSTDDEASRVESEKQMIRERALRVLLTSEARERLMNVKMVKPQIAKMIEDNIIQQASTGRLTKPVTDEELRQILSSIQPPKKDFKIRWA